MKPSPVFWNLIANFYSKQAVADEAAYQKKLKKTQEYLKPDVKVLEFGCGTGTTALIHAPYVKHIKAIDFSEKMIGIAKDKADAQKISNVIFEKGRIEDLDATEQSYDVIMGHSILHLLKDKETVIERVFELLKPGGYFVSSTICVGDTKGMFKSIAPYIKFIGMPWLSVFTKEQLIQSFANAGFEIDYQWSPGENKALFVIAKKS